jgi:hypothetical protein
VRTKSGQIIEYGNTTDSRIEAQGKTSVRTYQVNKISDTKGNYLTVTYTRDLPNGDFYPARIDYTGNTAASLVPFASVRFVPDPTPRTDVSSVYIGGSIIKTLNRFIDVQTYVGATLVRDYRLSYEYSPNGGASRLISIKECDGIGTGANCMPPHSFTWQNGTASTGLAAPVNSGGSGDFLLADINGDGLADMVYAGAPSDSPSIIVRFSNGGGGFDPAVVVGSADAQRDPYYGYWNFSPIMAADIDGDGRADVVTAGPAGSMPGAGNVRLSNGNSLAAPVNWGAPGTQFLLADINGDGLADMIYAGLSPSNYSPSIIVRFSNRSGFDPAVVVGSADAQQDPYSGYWDFSPIMAADLNGDGRADVITTGAYGSTPGVGNVRLSNGNSLAAPVNWGAREVLADMNGDGFADMVYGDTGPTGSPSMIVRFSNGVGFGPGVVVGSADAVYRIDSESGTGYWDFSPIMVGDFNGDGRPDVITRLYSGAGNVRLAQAGTPDFANVFTNSLGATTTVTYKPLTDPSVYTKDTPAAEWPMRDRLQQGPMYVVKETSASNAIDSNDYITTYFYTGAKVHMTGGGTLGFKTVAASVPTATGPTPPKITTTTTFRQVYPYQGLTASIVKTQPTGAILNRVTNFWTGTVLASPNNTGGYHRVELNKTIAESNDLNGTAFPTVTTTYSNPDAFGNVQDIVVSTPDGYSKAINNKYDNDTAHWRLGRLRRSTVTSTTP